MDHRAYPNYQHQKLPTGKIILKLGSIIIGNKLRSVLVSQSIYSTKTAKKDGLKSNFTQDCSYQEEALNVPTAF